MPLDLSLQALNGPAEPGEPRQVRLYRLLKDAILDGRLAPEESFQDFAQRLDESAIARIVNIMEGAT